MTRLILLFKGESVIHRRVTLRLLFFGSIEYMKRPSVFLSPPVFAVCLLLAHVCSADTSPGRLESVSIVRGGAGSSLAARTSALAVLVAATSVSTRTVVIELVGIVAEKRDVPITDAAGIISHLAIDTVRPSGGGAVTRIRISLARPYRHRLRMSGQVTYIDFERIAEPESVEVRRRSVERISAHESSRGDSFLERGRDTTSRTCGSTESAPGLGGCHAAASTRIRCPSISQRARKRMDARRAQGRDNTLQLR
jgi:hypothetical protein